MSEADERRLAVIMFTDTVAFTALAQRDEALAMGLLNEQRQLVRPLLAKYRGREVKTTGDGFLVEFGSALDAVRCAIDIQSGLAALNAERAAGDRLLVRIGIHLGDVIHTGEDVAGDAVNIASRIEPLAHPGGICLTAQVHASVVNMIEGGFESMGTPELKNVATPIEVFRLAGYGVPIAGSPTNLGAAALKSPAALPRDRVAVLPLANISSDPADEYFADGMTEELISSVSRTKGLRVIARTSVMRYKGVDKSIAEIGRELNVGSVLEGSVRKVGDTVRISVQFVDATNEEPQWSHEYDREIKDILAIQSDIARKVADALHEHVVGGISGARVEEKRSTNPDSYVNYLRGRQAWNQRTEQSLKQAINFFEASLGLHEEYAPAYAGLADSYATLALLEFLPPREAFPKAREAAGKALGLDPDLAEAQSSLALIKFQYDWDWQGAERGFREAISTKPSYAPAHHFFADYLKAMGRFDEALSEIETAHELDPLSLAINTGLGHVLYLSGQYDRAIEQYRRAVDLDPNFMMTHIWFGRPYLEKGMYAEAISELETAVRLSGESTLALAMLGHGLASAGQGEEALRILDKLKDRATRQYVPSYWIAVIYNGFRDREQVLTWLRKAFEERSSWLVWSNVEPRFGWLRDDPEFAGLMGEMNFPPASHG